jgi:SAM-dependent methyltransferase
MSIGTFFLRNRPELDCMCRLLDHKDRGSSLTISVLACSKGAEVYSIAFALRAARPDLKVTIHALDISSDVLATAEGGLYSLEDLGGLNWPDPSLIAQKGELAWHTWQGQDTSVFERMTGAEMEAMFERDGDQVRVRPQYRQGITWQLGDATDPGLANVLGPQDIVVANRFLCHLGPQEARPCLRNIARLVKPGGYLFVSGVDLEVRTQVALELGWEPVTDLLREIHEGDPSLTLVWPLNYCGLEPFDSSRADWKIRYASVFRVGEASPQNQR